MKSHMAFIVAGVMLLSLTSCSTIFGDNNRVVHINSKPDNAKVIVNNIAVNGNTPTDIVITKMYSPTVIQLQKPGCATTTVVVKPVFQKVGLWNLLILPGFIVDAITGDMMKVPQEQRNIDLKLC